MKRRNTDQPHQNATPRLLRISALALAALFAASIITASLAAPAGNLDTSFGNNGIVRIDFDSQYNQAGRSLAIQNDGKVVVAGFRSPYPAVEGISQDFLVARYNTDGSLDRSFGGSGWVTTDVNGATDEATSILWMYDSALEIGKTVIGGWSGGLMTLVRYCPDGSLDNGVNCGSSEFGSGGIARIDIGTSGQERIYNMAALPDGKIIVVGHLRPSHNPANFDFMVARINSNGSLDASFATGGVFSFDLLAEDRFQAVAIQPDGKILAGGYFEAYDSGTQIQPGPTTPNSDFIVMRLTSSGAVDSTFGAGQGYVTHHFGTGPAAVLSLAVQKDDKILAGGFWQNPVEGQHALVRFCPNGELDSGGATPNCGSAGFGVNGEVLTGSNNYSDEIRTLLIQADGKILAGGLSNPNGNSREFGINRYMAEDGSLDPTFGDNGMVYTRITDGPDQAMGMVINPQNGRITLSGEARDPTPDRTFDFALTRYLAHTTVSQALTPDQTVDFSGAGLTMRMDSGPGGGCAFTVSKYPLPAGGGTVGAAETPMYWTISSPCAPGSYSLTLTFRYTDVELLYSGALVAESELTAMYSPDGGNSWTNEGGSVNAANNSLTLSGVSKADMWWLASGVPSTTTVTHFENTVAAPAVELSWTTVWEGDLTQFDIYRSQQAAEHGVKINPAAILPKNPSGPGGAEYTYTDNAGLLGQSYYWLKLTLSDASTRWVGPSTAQISYPYAVNFQSSTANSQVSLSWNTVYEGELKQFDVFRGRSAGDHGSQINPAAILPKSLNGAAYMYIDAAGLSGQSYYWLRATLQDNSMVWYGPESVWLTYPQAVGFQAAVAASQVDLSWNTVWEGELKQFDVFRSRSNADHGGQINGSAILPKSMEGAAYSYSDASELPGQSYYWLRATLIDDSEVWFGPGSVFVDYEAASNFQASVSTSQVDLTWGTVWEGELKQFDIYRSRSNADHGAQINTGAIAPKNVEGAAYTFTDSDEQPGQSYYWLKATLLDDRVIWYGPRLVQISYNLAVGFQALAGEDRVDIAWTTAWEGEIKQFDVFRSLAAGEHGRQLNPTAILPKKQSGAGGASYTFTDADEPFGQSYYWLRITKADNTVVWVGPSSVTVEGYQLMLPLILR